MIFEIIQSASTDQLKAEKTCRPAHYRRYERVVLPDFLTITINYCTNELFTARSILEKGSSGTVRDGKRIVQI